MDMRSLLTLLVLLALVRGNKGQKPTVSLLPKFPQVYVGDDVTLICNRKKEIKPTKWFLNGIQQSHQDYSMLLTAVTPKNNGMYQCDQSGQMSDPFNITVLELEPHAQLSPSIGGAVMTKGDGRNLVLQVDDDLKDWACFALRGESSFTLGVDADEKAKRAVIFAELKEAERATFWCKKKKTELRSNAVTLKMTELMVMLVPPAIPALEGEDVDLRCVVWGGPKLESAIFYKDTKVLKSSPEGTYTITSATQDDNGKYRCHATYRFSHISAEAARREGDSDTQDLKVIGGSPAAVISESDKTLTCSCPRCPPECKLETHTPYLWYHTPLNDPNEHRKISENIRSITVKEEGLYRCRVNCGKGFSRFSNVYSYKASDSVNVMPILVAAILIILGVLTIVLIVLIALKRRRGGSSVQATKRDKDKTTGGDYEQIQLTDKDTVVYHTLGESTGKDQAEGGYEPLKQRKEEGMYHTLGTGEGQGQDQGQGQGEGGYEALRGVKAKVYQTLAVTVEHNPYEEVEKQTSREKE